MPDTKGRDDDFLKRISRMGREGCPSRAKPRDLDRATQVSLAESGEAKTGAGDRFWESNKPAK